MVVARRRIARARRQRRRDERRRRRERQLDETLVHVDAVRGGARLDERDATDVGRIDFDLQRRADVGRARRSDDLRPRREPARRVEQIRRRIDLRVAVDQRPGRAAAGDEHPGVWQQQRARVIEARVHARGAGVPLRPSPGSQISALLFTPVSSLSMRCRRSRAPCRRRAPSPYPETLRRHRLRRRHDGRGPVDVDDSAPLELPPNCRILPGRYMAALGRPARVRRRELALRRERARAARVDVVHPARSCRSRRCGRRARASCAGTWRRSRPCSRRSAGGTCRSAAELPDGRRRRCRPECRCRR